MEVFEEISFDEINLIGDELLPPIKVSKKSAYYPVLPREARMKIPDIRRAEDGSFPEGRWEWSTDMYSCDYKGHVQSLDVVHARENEEWIDEEEVTSSLAIEGLKLGREAEIATALFNETTWATDLVTIEHEMDDATNAVVFKVFDDAWKTIRGKCGLAKNLFSVILSDDLLSYMCFTDEVRNSVQYTAPIATMTIDQRKELLRNYLGFKEIKVTAAMFDNAKQDLATTVAKFWSNEYMMIAKLSNGGSSLKERCVGRQPYWTRFGFPYEIHSWYEDKTDHMYYRATDYRGKIIHTDYGILLKNAKTTVSSSTNI